MDEVYFSGVSSSTKTSTYESKTGTETESLEAQLDRLNLTLIGLLNPEVQDRKDSFSFQGSHENSMESEWKSLIPEEQTENTENYERLRMTCEDFRSHDVRSSQSSMSKLVVQCELADVYHLYLNLGHALESVESGHSKSVSLKVKDLNVKLMVKSGFYLGKKESIFKCFSKTAQSKNEKDLRAYVSQLENELEELKYKLFHWDSSQLDKMMSESFNDSFIIPTPNHPPPCHKCQDLSTQTSLEIQTKLATSLNQARKFQLSDLEWEVSTIKMLKSTYEQKQNDLYQKELKLSRQVQEINSEVTKKLKTLEKDRIRLQKEAEKQQMKNSSFLAEVKSIKSELRSLKENLSPEKVLTIQIPTPCATPKHEAPDDVFSIESEIASLENNLKNSADKNAVEFRINKLRTRLSTLRSARILNTCTNKKRMSAFTKGNNLPTATNKGNVFSFNIPVENIGATPRGTARSNTCFTERKNTSPLITERAQDDFAKEDNLAQTLELKEARLRRKEEDIIKHELKLQETWMKLPDANQLIPVVRHELERYLGKTEELKKTQSELDTLIKTNLESKRKNKLIEDENVRNNENLKEKMKSVEKIEEILSRLELLLN